ncbi:MAG: SRPBCC family protein [Planctomycetota bacterium]
MSLFESRFIVDAPLATVSAFHFQTGILKRLTPPMTWMQVHRFEPLANGSIADFTIWMGPIPVHWVAEHSEVTATRFIDIQIFGPMKSWKHTHTMTAINATQTEVHDHIVYEHHQGLRGVWSRLLFPVPALKALFLFRSWVTRRDCQRMSFPAAPSNACPPEDANVRAT